MNEKPIEWCFLWSALCLPSSEWASWAQAIFSAAAVLAAIVVVLWQQHVEKRQALAAAQLVASGLLTLMDQIIGGTQSITQGLNERIGGDFSPSNTPASLSSVLATLTFPRREDLLALNGAHPSCAIKLLRASNSMAQIQSALTAISALTEQGANAEFIPELLHPLHALATDAALVFVEAKNDLDNFCPK